MQHEGDGGWDSAPCPPTLFSLAMRSIHRALQLLPDIRYSLYADVTIWISQGSPGHIKETLQAALKAVDQAAHTIGLACSVEKNLPAPHPLLLRAPSLSPFSITPFAHRRPSKSWAFIYNPMGEAPLSYNTFSAKLNPALT
ncbi:unnamed protein product [Ixodes pacificus]